MAVKRFFGADGVLHEVEVPDGPVFVAAAQGGSSQSLESFLSAQNPTGVDPTILPIDAAQVPDLRPTDGAGPLTKFPDPIPGTGEGAGVGQRSGQSLRDVWQNNQDRVGVAAVDTVQSGPIGSAAAVSPRFVGVDEPRPLSPNGERVTDPGFGPASSNDTIAGSAGEDRVDPADPTQGSADERFQALVDGWSNKDEVRAYIVDNGGEEPHASATRAELEEAAREVFDRSQLA